MQQGRTIQRKQALLIALEQSLGIVTTACLRSNTSRDTFYRYCKDDPRFAKAVKDIEQITFDFVESKIYKQIQENNTIMIIFFAKTRMKERGYVERQELTGKYGDNITLNIVHPDKNLIEKL